MQENKYPRHVYTIFCKFDNIEKFYLARETRLELEKLPKFLRVKKNMEKEEYVNTDRIEYIKYHGKHEDREEYLKEIKIS